MGRKKTTEEVIETLSKHGLTLIGNYINSKVPIQTIDKDGYKRSSLLGEIAVGKLGKIFSSINPFCDYNVKLYVEKCKSNTIFAYEQNVTSFNQTICLKCGKCGQVYETTFEKFRFSVDKVCGKCAYSYSQDTIQSRLDIAEVLNLLKHKEFKLLDKEYKSIHTKMLIEDKQGYRYKATLLSIKLNQTPTMFSEIYNRENYLHNVQTYCKINNLPIKIVDIIKQSDKRRTQIKCECSCGRMFNATINQIQKGRYCCTYCLKQVSKYHRQVEKWLSLNNISYVNEQRFDDCRNNKPLPFDIYILDKNICIEIDGEGHYRESSWGGLSELNRRKFNDNIKTEYCKNNSIKLIRIPYWEFKNDNYIKILKQELNIIA